MIIIRKMMVESAHGGSDRGDKCLYAKETIIFLYTIYTGDTRYNVQNLHCSKHIYMISCTLSMVRTTVFGLLPVSPFQTASSISMVET